MCGKEKDSRAVNIGDHEVYIKRLIDHDFVSIIIVTVIRGTATKIIIDKVENFISVWETERGIKLYR